MSRFVNRRLDTSKSITFGVFESKFDLKGKFLYAMTKSPDGVFKFHRSIKSLFKELTSIPDITWCKRQEESEPSAIEKLSHLLTIQTVKACGSSCCKLCRKRKLSPSIAKM